MDDLAHVIYRYCLDALRLQFIEELGDARLQILGNLLAALTRAEIITERLLVGGEHLVGILVDGEEAPTKVDGYILFHKSIRS